MARKIIFGSIWLAFIVYSLAFSIYGANSSGSGDFQQDLDLIINMSIIEWEGINPIIIAIFFIMGIFPLVYGAFILFDSKEQPVSPYPFFLVSFGLGAFALLPYFALRQPDNSWNKPKGWLLQILNSRLMAIISSITILVFLVWGIINGDWSDFVAQWHTSQFIHVMSLDFCMLSLLLPAAIMKDDLERRGIKDTRLFWLTALVPLFGSLVYWCIRPQLNESTSNLAIEAAGKIAK